jgi:hypothetical protein
MDRRQPAKVPFDAEQYNRRSREGPCFVCSIRDGHPDYGHHDVYEDADTIAVLGRWPTLLGHCLVAPKQHVESWVHDLDENEYWHVVPLPPGVPYEQQQLHALLSERGVLNVDDSSQAALARTIRSHL